MKIPDRTLGDKTCPKTQKLINELMAEHSGENVMMHYSK